MRDACLILRPLALCLALCLGLNLGAALPAQAAGDDVNLCLCKNILARTFCKKASEFTYMGKLDEGVYILNFFYATKDTQYLCAVTGDGQVIIQDRTWRPMRRVIPYTFDSDGKCAKLTYSSPECPVKSVISCCPEKGPKDAKDQIKETFWNRPIPKILEEEYKAMTQPQANATAPAPEKQAPEK